MKKLFYLFIIISIWACEGTPEDPPPTPNQYIECNKLLLSCNNTGDYCLFGYKWGEGTDFENRGTNVAGPKEGGGIVSYSFQEKAGFVSNHRQIDVPTQSFDKLPGCAKNIIKSAFEDWAEVANIQFEELEDDSDSDIKIFVAPVTTCGNGYPNYGSGICAELSGHIILSPNYTTNCDIFRSYVLHELGHTLGLGHSSSENVMGSINTNLNGLRFGDIKGIREIYGE
ncbi:MAG: matrixin family metalloprotease [Bacteroidota bacterium]